MRLLWISNIPLPEASLLMGCRPSPYGGWMVGAAECISRCRDTSLTVAFPFRGIRNLSILSGHRIEYLAFPSIRFAKAIRSRGDAFQNIAAQCIAHARPDLVVVFGTESAHCLCFVKACHEQRIPVVLSIQGLLSILAGHFMANLPRGVQAHHTLRERILPPGNLTRWRRSFERLGDIEIEAIRKVRHVLGRTSWDKACTSQINPDATYHSCNEILRPEFYTHRWEIGRCRRFSIFMSQCNYPIKGLHLALEAMPLILNRFPGALLHVAGSDVMARGSFKSRLIQTSYGQYLRRRIRELDLAENIVFTGVLNEEQMCRQFLNAHVFVSASSIENESNALSEAKLLGVPCVASYVGGVVDRIRHGIDGFFYPWDAPYLLAYYVCQIFDSDELAVRLSEEARQAAAVTNSRERNTLTLLSVYNRILALERDLPSSPEGAPTEYRAFGETRLA